MSLLSNWLNADLFSVLRDKVNAIVTAVNPLAGGATGQYLAKVNGTDFNSHWITPPFDAFITSSVTSNTIDYSGNKTFTVASGLTIKKGNRLRAASLANLSNFIEGEVVSYSTTTLVIKPDVIGGTGTLIDWTISLGSGATIYRKIYTNAFSAITFTGGTATINSQNSHIRKGNGIINLSFQINFTSTSGFPSSQVTLTLNSELVASSVGTGSNNIGSAVVGNAVYPFNIYYEEGDLAMSIVSGNSGADIPSGTHNIIGNIVYAY